MTGSPLRSAYRLLLHLHPAPFQYRFGDEMLWIFDEESKRGHTAHLFFDAGFSLIRQRCTLRREPAQVSTGFGSLIVESGPGPGRILQAACLAALFCAGFVLFAGFGSRLLFSVQRPQAAVRCIFTLQASPPVETLPNPLKTLR